MVANLVTAKYLRSLGLSPGAAARFAAEWPEGAPLSIATFRRAAEMDLETAMLLIRVLQGDREPRVGAPGPPPGPVGDDSK